MSPKPANPAYSQFVHIGCQALIWSTWPNLVHLVIFEKKWLFKSLFLVFSLYFFVFLQQKSTKNGKIRHNQSYYRQFFNDPNSRKRVLSALRTINPPKNQGNRKSDHTKK
eukprot:Lithocolla_globosa_v1_NODE_2274_length_2078_cov_7.336134.p2 type:complete len:110 gc:universal NODE_2274_length_2078_cov_7.336134:674-1003(+)